MNLRRAAVLLAMTAGLVGCGPTAPTGEPTDGAGTARLDGIWVATKVDVPEGRTAFPQGGLETLVAMVKENEVTVRVTTGGGKVLLIQTEDAKAPKVYVAFETDETWDVTPKKEVTFHTAGQRAGAVGLWPHPRGVLKVVGDTATIAISPEPDVSSVGVAPTNSDKSPEGSTAKPVDRAAMIVFHLKRMKDLSEPAPPPPPMRPTFPSTAPTRTTGK